MIPNLPKPELNWDHASKVFLKENVLNPEFCESIISDNTNSLAKGVDKYPGVFTTSFHSCLLPLDHSVHAALQEIHVPPVPQRFPNLAPAIQRHDQYRPVAPTSPVAAPRTDDRRTHPVERRPPRQPRGIFIIFQVKAAHLKVV